MPRKASSQLNDVELAILRALWDRGPSTVRQVHDALQDSRKAGYSSTSKMMQVMCDKGLLRCDDATRPQIYHPAVPQEHTQHQIVSHLVEKVFGGSTRNLVLRAVESGRVKPDELAEIKKLLKRLDGERP